jgi:hypothetical protein
LWKATTRLPRGSTAARSLAAGSDCHSQPEYSKPAGQGQIVFAVSLLNCSIAQLQGDRAREIPGEPGSSEATEQAFPGSVDGGRQVFESLKNLGGSFSTT